MIPIYKAEKAAGLSDKIIASQRLTLASVLSVDDQPINRQLSKVYNGSAKAGAADFDLYPLKSNMVTTTWNLNDDVFDKIEVWAARFTPTDKPVNMGHVSNEIVGHIVEVEPTTDDSKVIASDASADELPPKYHLYTKSVLYKVWDKPEKEEAMAKLFDEIKQGKWFVSMECLMANFDYALLYPDGTQKIIMRTSSTAELTQHLRIFGGTGEYQGAKIGRLIRGITFSGLGIVARPANPESIIFATVSDFSNVTGYITDSEGINNGSKIMANEIETLTQKNDELSAKLSAHVNQIAEKDKKNAELENKLQASVAECVSMKTALADANKALEEATALLAKVDQEKKIAARIVKLSKETNMSTEEATKVVDTLVVLADENFDKFVETIKAKIVKVEQPKINELVTPEVNSNTSIVASTNANVEAIRAEMVKSLSGKTGEKQ